MSTDSPYHSLTSFDGHTKRFVIIGVFVIALVALAYYLTLPGHGDPIAIPPDLGIAVRDHFKDKEGRNVTEMDAFRCDSFDDGGKAIEAPDAVVKVVLENRRARLEEDERTGRWAALANYKGDREWQISSVPLPSEGSEQEPCRR